MISEARPKSGAWNAMLRVRGKRQNNRQQRSRHLLDARLRLVSR